MLEMEGLEGLVVMVVLGVQLLQYQILEDHQLLML